MKKKFSWLTKDVLSFSATSFFSDVSHEMTTALLPSLILHITSSYAPFAVGIIMGIADAVSMMSKLFAGYLSTRLTSFKFLIVAGYALSTLCTTLLATATTLMHFLLYETGARSGAGLREPLRDAWLAHEVSSAYYGRMFGFQRACDTMGAIVGPLLAFVMVSHFSVRSIFFIAAIPGSIAVLVVVFGTTHYRNVSQRSQSGNLTGLWRGFSSSFLSFLLCALIFALGNFNKVLLIFRVQQVLLHETSSSFIATSSSLMLYILYNCLRAIAELGMGSLSDYTSRKWLLAVCGYGLFAVSSALVSVVDQSFGWWGLIFFCAGVSNGTVTSLEKSYAAQLLPDYQRGSGFGLLAACKGGAQLVSSILVGFIWNWWSAAAAFVFATLISLFATLLLLLHRE